jgi:gluconate 5-dehydrogenase
MSAPVRVARLAEWRGKRALVTGASSGIGRLFAQRIARAGARVALVARREAELHALAAEIDAAGGEAAVVPADVGDCEQALRCAERAAPRSAASTCSSTTLATATTARFSTGTSTTWSA